MASIKYIYRICDKCKISKHYTEFNKHKRGDRKKYCSSCDKIMIENKNIKHELLKSNQKICSECKQIKQMTDFCKEPRRINAYQSRCKKCVSEHSKQWYINNKEKRKIQIKNYRKNNKEKLKKAANIYAKNRLKTDIQFKIRSLLRHTLRRATTLKSPGNRTVNLLGCSVKDFIKYIESLWQPNMNWTSFGNKIDQWNFDHILPCELFNLLDVKQQQICFNHKNIRPLWKRDNDSKGDLLYNGLRARNLNKEEKLSYLKLLGYNI